MIYQDWHHLGLADLLDAATGDRIPDDAQIPLAGRVEFGVWAMKFADLGGDHGKSWPGRARPPLERTGAQDADPAVKICRHRSRDRGRFAR
ncbi:hypothetical protein [Kitasatospora sp. NPDC002965]|uniref:hypothetical protein n=1 Tax=Kitasatospora sp. NPDC002965 TaxID=3154775 RepID=UPI0033B8ACEB